ncbi:hypothetical protein [Pedobacter sandarakinus]|uniref:hypothetical protein n=1 Tax=Pedobacter sandarakinus TaxID=353156 RepID=UPI0022467711|nr:hypothetical protein [Pedobacter sandarakinus]MCX2575067.1 hypothetical protein [Pedobacter sandarakinus]
MNDYQTNIFETVEILNETKHKLIQKVFDLAITGELKEWSDTIDVGEHFFFTRELFESLEDNRIKMIVALIDHLEVTLYKL